MARTRGAMFGALTLVLGLATSAQVAAEAPPGRFTVDASTVKDNKTGLVWQRTAREGQLMWEQAQEHCSNLSLDGGGWRAPRRTELYTLVDVRAREPATDTTAFPDVQPDDVFWTSSLAYGQPYHGWAVDFFRGDASLWGLTDAARVRCVR